jgi:hypothetical protein
MENMHRRTAVFARLALLGACLIGAQQSDALDPAGGATPFGVAAAATTFRVPEADLPNPLTIIAYGDMRFTDPSRTMASRPPARQALVARIADEHPAAVFINGDLPLRGTAEDYAVYQQETSRWREQHLRVYPALGNHEFAGCAESECLDRWWSVFPELRGHRWYSVALGSRLVGIALDSDASLLPGSEQRQWLESQVSALDGGVQFVLVLLHHPPVADVQTRILTDHNPRPNERALAQYLSEAAAGARARFVVVAGHIHNYERFAKDGVVYLVSGGGGASPYEVDRSRDDLSKHSDLPNFHYLRLELRDRHLIGRMMRLRDYAAASPGDWEIGDRFELTAKSPRP